MSLTDGPPDLPYPKLPFWDTVGLSYSTYFSRCIDVLRASWLWLLVVAAFTAITSWQQWSWMTTAITKLNTSLPPQMPKPTEMGVLLTLDNILVTFAGMSIAVAWHRLMILNEQPGFSGGNVRTGNMWRYIVVAIALLVVMLMPAAAFLIPAIYFLAPSPASRAAHPEVVVWFLFGCLAYPAGMAAGFRLLLLLPARAVGNIALTFKQVWNRTRGNVWRLFWGFVATTTPAQLAYGFVNGWVNGFASGFTTQPSPGTNPGEGFAAQMTAMDPVFSLYSLLTLPIGIGFLSHAYRHFFVAPLDLTQKG